MAITTIGNIVTGNIPVLASYMTEDPVEKTAFFDSGIITPTPYASEIAKGPSNIANLPFWKAIDTSIEPNYSNDVYQDIATPRAIQTGEMMARVAYLNEGFGQADLTVELTSQNPLQSVASRLDNFWQRQAQRRLIATALGLYNNNVSADDDYHKKGDMVVDVSASANKGFDAGAFIDATQTMGDALMGSSGEVLGAIAMHSFVYAQARKAQLIDFIRDAENNTMFATYQGYRVIVDDSMTVVGQDTSRKFISIIFGQGAIGYGEGNPSNPLEYEREASRGNGGGVETLWTRKTWLLHPFGYSFTSAVITGNGTETIARSASWQDLANATNWNRVVDRKHVPIAFLVTGAGA
ncbi:major head protein [Salmonella phage Jersey]|uniref:Major capsid protein n=1 Tax=Salmonella phage Jersey TaxID=1340534 RepID=S4X0W4_9CAUD|nr:major head protein [Salmonella phage Jersey]AGP24900.1 major capsid protein [Salmonella phage Jersey]